VFITEVAVRNFKTFQEEKIKLNNLNIVIGSNAAGKSNFINVFRFIDQIIECGIDNAISMSGGIEYVLNTTIGRKQPLSLYFSVDCSQNNWELTLDKKNECRLLLTGFDYTFEIMPHKKGSGYKIVNDIIKLRYWQETENNSHNDYSVEYKRCNGKIYITPEDHTSFKDEKINNVLKKGLDRRYIEHFFSQSDSKKELMLTFLFLFLPPFFRARELVKIYDFDPKLMKKPSMLTSISNLEEDGSNIASILQDLLKSKTSRKRLENLLKDSLPFVESISTESRFDKSISYKIKEKYSKKELYSHFLSDGTVNILALIVAMFFDSGTSILIFEEPERNLHPQLMSRLLEMAYETSKEKQIIITTHTPEMLKYAKLDSILLAQRCDEGYTRIKKPADSEMVKNFLENEVGIEDLFIQNLLGE